MQVPELSDPLLCGVRCHLARPACPQYHLLGLATNPCPFAQAPPCWDPSGLTRRSLNNGPASFQAVPVLSLLSLG